MRKYLGFLFSICFILFLLSVDVYAEDPMYDFYSGLADIIERNMDSPDKCVAEAESFIRENIKPLLEATERGRRMAQSGMYEDLSEEEVRGKLEEMGDHMSQSGSMKAINRFMNALDNFSTEYPQHGENISDILSGYQPQFGGKGDVEHSTW